MTKKIINPKYFLPFILVLIATISFSVIAISFGETVNSFWFISAAVCIYLIGYRFYSAFVAAKLLAIDSHRQTPATKFRDGRDYEPTNKWIVFGHHFAAIAGPGPLIGPTLAAQFGYLPGLLWILVGSVIGGCIQDMVILFYSVRHNGKTLCQMAKDELGKIGGISAVIGTIMIMIILIAVLGLVVVNAMKHSAWATSTVFATIPIAVFIGIYMRFIRPGAVLEASLIGFVLLLCSVFGGQFIAESVLLKPFFDHDGLTLSFAVIAYGFIAAVLPVWLLLAPRDYISTFLKLGTILSLALAIILLHPEIKMPAITRFVDGTGPIFAGKIFPFMFITIACGAISGFHALIASGTTPKLIANEKDIRMIGYGAMALESFVALMALIAATVMEPGIFFAINSPASVIGSEASIIVQRINDFGFKLNLEDMKALALSVGEDSLFNRVGGAPSLAIGMASIFSKAFGNSMLAIWYHFIIMFEAIFILTALDAGTRVCRFMLQDALGNFYKPLGKTSHYPSILLTSFLVVLAWGYFLYAGVTDPNGGVNMLWPLFGIANQILAAIALAIATSIIIKSDKVKYFWITVIPLFFLVITTLTAAYQKIFSSNPRIGALAAAEKMGDFINTGLPSSLEVKVLNQLIMNQYAVAILTFIFAIILILIIWDLIFIAIKANRNIQIHKFLSLIVNIFQALNGDQEYKKYLIHHKENHSSKKALSRRDFFAKKEQDKWGKINRCC